MRGQGKTRWLEWQDKEARLRAVDNNQFYGFYCMVFEQKTVANKMAELRKTKGEGPATNNQFVDAVTTEDSASDSNPDIIDRITGKIRRRQDAPETAAAPGKGNKPTVSASTPASAPATVISEDDDPLKGLL